MILATANIILQDNKLLLYFHYIWLKLPFSCLASSLLSALSGNKNKKDNFSSNSRYMSFSNRNLAPCSVEKVLTCLWDTSRYTVCFLTKCYSEPMYVTGWRSSVVYWLSENSGSRGNNSRRYNTSLNTLCHISIFCIVILCKDT